MSETLARLASLAMQLAQNDGITPTTLNRIDIFRFNSPDTPTLYSVYPMSFTLTLSGSKQVACGQQILQYGAGHSALVSLDMPISANIIEADERTPYLCVHIALDWAQLARLSVPNGHKRDDLSDTYALSVVRTEDDIVDTVYRLLQLAQNHPLQTQLEPLLREELAIRLLHGKHGATIQRLLQPHSTAHKIAQAVIFLKQHFANKINMEGLANSVAMSPTAFRKHFRTITGFSPLQYQKQLRLQQARLLLLQGKSVSQTANEVGYESISCQIHSKTEPQLWSKIEPPYERCFIR